MQMLREHTLRGKPLSRHIPRSSGSWAQCR